MVIGIPKENLEACLNKLEDTYGVEVLPTKDS
jgi:hypothetical protein